MAAVTQDITAEQGAALAVTFTGAGASLQGRMLRMHVRSKVGVTTTKLVASTTDGRLAVGANPYTTATLAIDADVMAAVSITLPTEYWVYDVESYTTAADVRREWSGRFTISRDVTRDTEATTETALSGAVLYSGPQSLTTAQQDQAWDNIGGDEAARDAIGAALVAGSNVTITVSDAGDAITIAATGGGGGSGDVVGPAGATDGRITEFDGTTGKLIKQSSYTIASLIAYVVARASHTGTQLAATISDFASAAIAAVTWSTITGKPSTFDPSAHKTNHATGGADALTASDIGAQSADATLTALAALDSSAGLVEQTGADTFTKRALGVGASTSVPTRADADARYAGASHDHTGVYQPLATVLTNTTAAFTTAQETKLSGIETAADVTDAGNVGTAIDSATAKTTPVDADAVPLIDSAAANVLKKLSWANIKATLKTYFDAIYVTIGGALGTPSSGALTNCTFPTLNQNTSGYAEALKSATTTVTVSAATAPSSGQVLTATSSTAATWQTPSGGSPGGSTTQVQYNNAGAFAGNSSFTYSGGLVTMQFAVATSYFASLSYRATGNNATAMAISADSLGDYARDLTMTGAPAKYAPYGLVGGAITITAGAGNTSPGTGACHGGAVNIVGGAKSDTGTDGAVNLAYTGSAARGAVKSWGAHTFADVAKLAAYTVATVPSASTSGAGATIYVSDESGGAVLAFSDATNWRRVTDRAVIS